MNLTNEATNSITICLDTLLDYPENTLSKLQNKDTISINFESNGCFQSSHLKISITKETDKLVAKLYNVSLDLIRRKGKTTLQEERENLLQKIVLTNKNIQDFIRFENELNYVTDGGCTTTDFYTIKSKYLNTKKTDGSCDWHGFNYLRKSLFGDKK